MQFYYANCSNEDWKCKEQKTCIIETCACLSWHERENSCALFKWTKCNLMIMIKSCAHYNYDTSSNKGNNSRIWTILNDSSLSFEKLNSSYCTLEVMHACWKACTYFNTRQYAKKQTLMCVANIKVKMETTLKCCAYSKTSMNQKVCW